jgi:Domain of unknown function (DUF5916)/Carbohydrate family 9 binding domain-like
MVRSGGERGVLVGVVCVVVFLLHWQVNAQQSDPPRLDAIRLAGEITLNGELDEPSWSEAPMAQHFIQNDPREGMPATFDTEVRVLYDDEALYFGVFAKDDQPSQIIANDLKKDFDTNQSDGFRIILDTFHDKRNGYQFATNPAGAKWDAQMVNEGRESNANWDGIWDVATRITETGWYAEIRIPFRTLRFSAADAQVWGMNFERKLRRLNEDSYWSPVARIYDIQRVSLAGTLEGMRGVRPGKDLRVKPYVLSSGSTIAGQRTRGDFEGGLDVKYGVTPGLTWDFTVNTDFSQVEADEQQVNLTRFSLFFPEKRDFFLENSGVFQFGGAIQGGGGNNITAGRQNQSQDMRLFFSRRIGLSDEGQVIPILGGTRLTGRQGAYSVGLLNIQQREDGSVPATNFTALRLRRDILANSDIGAIVLNKEVGGPHFNRVAGVDANFRFAEYLTTGGYLTKTFSPEQAVPASGNELASRANILFDHRRTRIGATVTAIGQRFNDELGFVPRRGIINYEAQANYRFRPRSLSKWIREIQPHWNVDMFKSQADGSLESRYQDFHFPINFQDGTFFEAGVNPNVEVIKTPFTINSARGIRVNPGRYEFDEYFILVNSNQAAPFAMGARYSNGEFYDGYRRSYSLGPSFRMNENFNMALAAQVQDVELSTGDYVTTLITGRVNYNFNTRMFVNALLQYNTDSHQWSSNLRFNIIHRPLSDFFLVYNERRDERSGDLMDRAIVAKMTYLMAF